MIRWRNPDGTYNGVKALAALSHLSEDEVAWTFNRLKYWLFHKKKSVDEAKALVAEEAKDQPWKKS